MKHKRVIAFLLAATLTAASAMPVMADETDKTDLSTADQTQDIEVPVTLDKEDSSSEGTVYKATITWSAGSITGKIKGNKYKWNPDKTRYERQDDSDENRLADNQNLTANVTIKVTNKSNASVYYKIEETDLDSAYTLTHSNSGVASTEITAADLVDSDGNTTTTALASMTAGSEDETALTGKGIESAEFIDTITLTATTKTAKVIAENVTKYTVTISKDPLTETVAMVTPEVTAFTYKMTNGTVLSSADLLATSDSVVAYTYNGATNYAYTGYIASTSGANYSDATGFVENLNTNTTNGNWHLLYYDGANAPTGDYMSTEYQTQSEQFEKQSEPYAYAMQFSTAPSTGDVKWVWANNTTYTNNATNAGAFGVSQLTTTWVSGVGLNPSFGESSSTNSIMGILVIFVPNK